MSTCFPHLHSKKNKDIASFDGLFKNLKDNKDWLSFCKILYLYFEGVFSLTDFFKLYEEKFSAKLKSEVKEDIEKLLPTRDMNRRALSNMLKPWNDVDN